MSHRYEDVISLENLCLAWQEFVRGKRGKHDVQEFGRKLMDNIIALHEDLANKTYVHGGYQSFRICDPKPRHIHKASVRDRLLHHAIYRILYPFFERTFIADSFSCRDDKGTHKALDRFRAMAYKVSRNHTRTCWVLKCDIKQFFSSIDHRIMFGLLASHITDQDIMWLIGQVIGRFDTENIWKKHCTIYFRSEINGTRGTYGIGLPLGNLTSQLFSNIYMNEFDQFVKHRLKARHYIRYADDFVFFSDNRDWLLGQVPCVREFLYEKLRLELHPAKISIKAIASGVDFLGWVHFPNHRVLRGATKRRMMRCVCAHPTNELCNHIWDCYGMEIAGRSNRRQKRIIGYGSEGWYVIVGIFVLQYKV